MGLKGAAIASVMAEAASFVFGVVYTWIYVDLKKYGLNRWPQWDSVLLGRILGISCFTMVQYFVSMATWFVFFMAVERLGQRELAVANIIRSIYIVLLIPVQALSTAANTLVSNLIGAGGVNGVMRLLKRIAKVSLVVVAICIVWMAFFPQMFLSVYTNDAGLIAESVPSLYVIGVAMLVAAVANIYFNGISGTGNTQAALWLESGTLVVYGVYVFVVGWWMQAPVSVCFTTEIVYYALLFITSLIYLKKANWQNKKI
jgi:Na+-driven multidrug efflux pump